MFLAEMFSINVILQDIQRLKIFTLKAFSVYVFTFQYLLELLDVCWHSETFGERVSSLAGDLSVWSLHVLLALVWITSESCDEEF